VSDRPVAAIDCGTNSTRLLVADADGKTIERLMHITRLGRDVDRTGRLAAESIDATGRVLREYREVLDRHGVERVRMTATSAARDASNRDEFFEVAAEIIGQVPELLTGDEEALLSFAGATAELDPADGPFLVADIGGGSTEFAVGTTHAVGQLSLDIGCVRMTEKYLLHDPPLPEELTATLQVVETYLDDVARELPEANEARCFVGLAGTVTTVAALDLGLKEYDAELIHHHRLGKDAVEEVFRELATETLAQRLDEPGMEAERADVIVGGCCILVAIMRYFAFESCLVSESDILNGLVASLLE
jgi:exopolyphosphatase/guanosine-5'-triphosphate,3'-diphosphate pyrophosphatase